MAQRQFRSDDTDKWKYGFGSGSAGNGSINTSTDAPIDSACSGTSGTTSLTATNASFATGQLILIHQTRGTGAGNWELNKIASYTAGTITTVHSLCNTYTNSGASVAQVIVMTEYNDLTINSGQTFTAKAWNGTVGGIIAKFVKSTFTVAGTVSLAGQVSSGRTGGAGIGFRGGNNPSSYGANEASMTGESPTGASIQQNGANGAGGGGAHTNGVAGGGGGGGSHATNGATGGEQSGGSGGQAATTSLGTAALTTMLFGGAGGGAIWYQGASAAVTGGGGGGGIVLIIAKSITVTGSITVAGGTSAASTYATGGGGAGGSCLIKCQTATLGTNLITATGGVPPTPTEGGFVTCKGGNGGSGRIHIDYKTSYTGTTNPTLDVTQDATLDSLASSNFFAFFN